MIWNICDLRWLTIRFSRLSLVRVELFTLSRASFRAWSCSESLRRREASSSCRDRSYKHKVYPRALLFDNCFSETACRFISVLFHIIIVIILRRLF